MRRSSVRWACGWFNNAEVRAWIGQSFSLPWLFSRQTKPKEMLRQPESDLEEGECVWERETVSTCGTPVERLRQSLCKQTKNKVAHIELDGKEMWKRTLQGPLLEREAPDVFFLTAHESCTVSACPLNTQQPFLQGSHLGPILFAVFL